jgi:hypothetical protein
MHLCRRRRSCKRPVKPAHVCICPVTATVTVAVIIVVVDIAAIAVVVVVVVIVFCFHNAVTTASTALSHQMQRPQRR